jgi:DNA processing protein
MARPTWVVWKPRGGTLAIMGTGIDKVYPTLHKKLAHRILDEGGALISEYGRGAPGGKHQFPLSE